MENNISSPFDQLILKLAPWNKPTEFGIFIRTYLGVFRVLFIQFQNDKIAATSKFDEIKKSMGIKEMTDELWLREGDMNVKIGLDYYQFISQLNRFAIIMERKFHITDSIPLRNRIRFFRNKVSEHWSDYLQHIPVNGWLQSFDKIPTPTILGSRPVPVKSEQVKTKLIEEFSKFNVDVIIGDTDWYEPYSKIIYSSLEKIDSQLNSEPAEPDKAQTSKYIPESLITLLFEFDFPIPVYDIEEYCQKIAENMGKLNLLAT